MGFRRARVSIKGRKGGYEPCLPSRTGAKACCDQRIETAKNIQKREVAVTQLVAHVHDVIETTKLAIKGIVIGGDFNTNHDQEMFATEKTLDSLIGAGYQNGFEELPLSQRITHPGTHGFPDAPFDFLFTRDLKASSPIVTQTNASDH